MAPAIRSGVLLAIVTVALALISRPAGAQDGWQDPASASPFSASNAPAWYSPADRPQQELVRLPAVEAADLASPATYDTLVRPADFVPDTYDATAELPDDAQFYTIDELREEMKKLAWVKGEYKIIPYGMLWGSAYYATERTSPNGYVLFVNSASEQGESAFTLDTRRTRLGLDIGGPRVDMPLFGCMESSGRVEVDFFGAFATAENRAGVLFRHGYGQLKNDNWRLLAGQTFDLISPLWPGTISYPVGWGGGNIGYRRMQILLDRYLSCSDTCLVTVSGSINQNIVTDFTDRPTEIRPETTAWPIVMSRLGVTLGERGPGCRPITMGVSGHIGEQGFDFLTSTDLFPPRDDVRVKTWSVNADVKVPIGERLGVQGEFFTGTDLGTFFGGAFQGINPITETGIRSTGGWVELWYDWAPRLHSHFGYGVDDPLNSDLYAGGRLYNSFLFGNLVFDVTKKMILGFEVNCWDTHYAAKKDGTPLEPGEAVVFEFTGSYNF